MSEPGEHNLSTAKIFKNVVSILLYVIVLASAVKVRAKTRDKPLGPTTEKGPGLATEKHGTSGGDISGPQIEKVIAAARSRVHWTGQEDVDDLEAVIGIVPLRQEALADSVRRLSKVEPNLNMGQLFSLASTDLFVEKAQLVLTRRSNKLYVSGVICVVTTFIILAGAISLIVWNLLKPIDANVIGSSNALILRIFQSVALSAFVLVGVKYLVTLARSFFHEAISLLERRHALRFGRLYVYLKRGEIDFTQLEEAFQWNKETKTSFLDHKPEVIAETLLHKIIEALTKAPTETVKVIAETAAKLKKG